VITAIVLAALVVAVIVGWAIPDPIVASDVTARLVDKLCAEGDTVDLRVLKGTAHLDTGHVALPDVVQWIADRFAGKPAPTTCALAP